VVLVETLIETSATKNPGGFEPLRSNPPETLHFVQGDIFLVFHILPLNLIFC
jgi:hypothetical protein